MIGGYSTLTPVRPLVLVSPILHYKENVQFLDAFISTLTRQLQHSNAVLSSSWSFLKFTAIHHSPLPLLLFPHTGLPPPPPDPTMSVNSCSGFEHISWPRIDFTDHRNSVKMEHLSHTAPSSEVPIESTKTTWCHRHLPCCHLPP